MRMRCIEVECHPYYREEACSLVIGLFRSQEGAPSSEEETHVLSRCLLLARTRLRRDETSSVCMCERVRARKWLHNSVYVEGGSHLTTSPKCPLPIQAVEVDSTWLVYTPVSSFLMVYFRRPVCWQQPSYQSRACSSMCPWRLSLKKRMSSHWNNAEMLVKCWKKAIYGIFLTNHSKRNPSPLLFICLHYKNLIESSWSFYRLFLKP